MPSWPEPARVAPSNSGFHTVPVRNSSGGMSLKKRMDSKITEKIIPIVVIIAIREQIIKPNINNFSTAFLALNCKPIELMAKSPIVTDDIIVSIEIKISEYARQLVNLLAKSIIHISG